MFFLLTNEYCGELLCVIGSGIICDKYDQTLQDIERLLDHVNADILVVPLDCFVGLHALFGHPKHDDD